MSETRSLALVEDGEYALIESAVMESGRGRRFLAEYARRNRSADTDMLLGAIGRLENSMTRERGGEDVGRLHGDLMEMAQAISRTRAEISALQTPDQDQSRLTVASEDLDAIVRATETATSDILGAAEDIQEAAWTLREGGAAPAICDELDRRATQIYTACSFQDLTAQRTSRIVHTLRYLEDRIASMIAIWGPRLDVVPPPAPGETVIRPDAGPSDLCQSDVDRFLDNEVVLSAPEHPRRTVMAPLDDDIAFLPIETMRTAQEAPAPVMDEDSDAATALALDEVTTPPDEIEADPEPAVLDADGLGSDAFELALQDLDIAIADEVAAGTSQTEETVSDAPAESAEPARETTRPPARGTEDDIAFAFGDLDTLTIEEKLALFA